MSQAIDLSTIPNFKDTLQFLKKLDPKLDIITVDVDIYVEDDVSVERSSTSVFTILPYPEDTKSNKEVTSLVDSAEKEIIGMVDNICVLSNSVISNIDNIFGTATIYVDLCMLELEIEVHYTYTEDDNRSLNLDNTRFKDAVCLSVNRYEGRFSDIPNKFKPTKERKQKIAL